MSNRKEEVALSNYQRNDAQGQSSFYELIGPLVGKDTSDKLANKFGSLREVFIKTDEELVEAVPELEGEQIERLRAAFKLRSALNLAVPENTTIRKPEQAIDLVALQGLELNNNQLQAIILDADLNVIETQPLRRDAKWVFEQNLEAACEGLWNYEPAPGEDTTVVIVRGVENANPLPDEEDQEYFYFFDTDQSSVSNIFLTDYIVVSMDKGTVGNKFYSFSRNGEGDLDRIYQTVDEMVEESKIVDEARLNWKRKDEEKPGAEFI